MNIYSVSPKIYNSNNRKSNPTFTGLTNNKIYNAIESKVISGCIAAVKNKKVEELVTNTSKNKNLNDKLMAHLIVLGSTLLSGFYMIKTLNNKNMDEEKRKTLAINQGLTYVLSTIMAYTFDNWARNTFTEKIINKFEKVNKGIVNEKEMKMLKSGFGIARTIIIVDTVYRFIAPVIVTPFANYIGNHLNKNKNA